MRGAGIDGRRVALLLTSDGETAYRKQRLARVGWLTPFAAELERDLADAEATLERLLGLAGGTADEAEHLCRLCDERVCPQDRCPVTVAIR
jgi:MarR family transcriptional repressor of emrRAB